MSSKMNQRNPTQPRMTKAEKAKKKAAEEQAKYILKVNEESDEFKIMTTEEYKTLIDEKLAEGAELDDIPKLVVGDTDEVNQENGNGEIYQYLLDKNLITPEDIPSNE